jgi:hypothetical protein
MRTAWLVTALLTAALPALAAKPPKVQWTRTFVGWGGARGFCVQQTSDGGYIAVGYTGSPDSSNDRQAALLVKLGASGDSQWVRTIKADDGLAGFSIVQTSDGGYVLAGSGSPGQSRNCAYLIKTNASGDEVWRTFLRDSFPLAARSVARLGDTAYTAVVKSLGDSAVLLWRIDSGGRTRWSHRYGIQYDPEFRDEDMSLRRTSDGGCIIGTKTLLKVDSLGAQPQLKTFGSIRNANSVIQTSDGGYAATGATLHYSSIYLLKTNANRDRIWMRTYMPSDASRGHWVEQAVDGGYIIAGTIRPDGQGEKATLVRTRSDGAVVWSDTLFSGQGACVRQTTDGGYVACGSLHDRYLLVAKLAPERRR